jgi:hypothetical protein
LPRPHELYRFENGNYIFRNGQIILPTSKEGQEIVEIFKAQELAKKLNEEQEKLWKEVTSARNAEEALKLLIKPSVQRNPTPPSQFKFSTGNFIFLKRGVKDPKTGEIIKKSRLIDPKSEEGIEIEHIFDLQRQGMELNEKQKQRQQTLIKISSMEDTIDFLLNDEHQK